MKQSIDLMGSNDRYGLTVARMFYLVTGFSALLIGVVLVMAAYLWVVKQELSDVQVQPATQVTQSEKTSSVHDLEYVALKNIFDHAVYKPLWAKQLNPVSMSRIMTVLASSNIESLWLDGFEVDFAKRRFQLSGKTQDPKALMSWLRYLRQAQTFGKASLVGIGLNPKDGDYEFRVEGHL